MMKVKVTLCIVLISFFGRLESQVSIPTNVNIGNSPAWYVGWNPLVTVPLRIEHQGNQQITFSTNGFNRMFLDNGGAGQAGGRLALGNNLPAGFAPQSRLHIHQTGVANNNTYIRFTNSLTGPGPTNGFAIGNTSNLSGPANGDVNLLQYQPAPLIMLAPNAHSAQTLPYEWFRLQNGTITPLPTPGRSNDGYIGLNKPNPRSHIEMVTPAFNGGEEFFMAKPDDIYATSNVPASGLAPNVQMGMMNLTGLSNQFLPGVFGNLNQPAQTGVALELLAGINAAADINVLEPVMRFNVGRDWIINSNIPGPVSPQPNQAIVNRPIFGWQNANPNNTLYMYMAANGRLRIGSALFTGNPPTPERRPNNRIEITADAIDPYYNPAGNPIGNPNWFGSNIGGASGLRFTYCTSRDLVIAPTVLNEIDPTKVLSTDKNGDVVLIRTLGAANNGLSVVNGTVQLGATCGSPSVALANLLNSRVVPLNNFNFIFSGQGVGATNRVGIGIPGCAPGNKLEIDNGVANPNTSGLRLTRLTSASPTQVNPGLGVLTVDASGDVIYVPGGGISQANNGVSVSGGIVQLGGTCNSATVGLAALTNNREVPLNGNHFVFSEATNGLGRVGIGKAINCAPGNQLEINNGTPGNVSGLRLTDLANNPVAQANPFNKVLAVDVAGDVILTNLPATGGLGGVCGTNPPALTNSWEIPLGGFNYLFSGNNTGTVVNNVGIGLTGANLCLPQAKLHVEQSSGSVAGSMGLLVENNDLGPCNNPVPVVAIKGIVNTPNNTTGDQYRVGGWFEAPFSGNCGIINNYALYVPQNGGFISFGYPVPQTNGGLLNVNGVTWSTGGYTGSDITLKNTVTTLPNSLNKVKNLRPVTFKWNTVSDSLMNGTHAGFIAQEVDTVIPQLVRTSNNGIKSVAYSELIPYLVSAIQEQQKQIQKMDSTIQALSQNVASCCSNSAARQTGITGADPKSLTQINVNLSDVDMIVLNQNVPNPFAEQTTITYNVPEKYGFAQLIFKTVDGKIIKTVDITKKGRGQVNVFANDLSNGLYMYSLIVDGMTMDTKKMVKQN